MPNNFQPETKQDNIFYGSVRTNVNVNEIRDNAKICKLSKFKPTPIFVVVNISENCYKTKS